MKNPEGAQYHPLPESEPFAFSLIAPYGNLAALFARATAGLPCALSVREGFALEEGPAIAREELVAHAPEVIFSRGGTAGYIRDSVDVPVVSISTTAIDLLRALQPFAGKVRKAAFFNYRDSMPEVQAVASTLYMDIEEYSFHTRDDLVSRMLEARARGAELAAGGILVVRARDISGMDGILVEAGEDAVHRALHEAFSIARIRRVDQRRHARMATILDTVAESVLVTDENNALTLINAAAERLLGVHAAEVLGRDARDVVPNNRTAEVLRSGNPELNKVQDMGGTLIVTNRVPIIVDKQAVGVVCTFTEAGRIRQAEQRLRDTMKAKGFRARYRLDDIITGNKAMLALKELAAMYAATDATVLLQGESGTGKELFAQGVHLAGKRAGEPFVPVNCAAIPETLLESELFGYEEGAFTGAKRQGKAGLFEQAHRGTLFLDEVSELPASMQARLLRALQEREIVRIGGARVIPVDVRIVCATNRDLEEWTESGNFRQDLYYRLNVLPLTIPPLRERKGDIPLIAQRFLMDKLPRGQAAPDKKDLDGIMARLTAHHWPGNARELRNVMERLALAVAMMPGETLEELLGRVWNPGKTAGREEAAGQGLPNGPAHDLPHDLPHDLAGGLRDMTRRFERETIHRLLEEHGRNQGKVAAILGISRMSLWRKLREEYE